MCLPRCRTAHRPVSACAVQLSHTPSMPTSMRALNIVREVVANHDGLLRQTRGICASPDQKIARVRLIHTGFLTRNKAVHLARQCRGTSSFSIWISASILVHDGHLNARAHAARPKTQPAPGRKVILANTAFQYTAECLARIAERRSGPCARAHPVQTAHGHA